MSVAKQEPSAMAHTPLMNVPVKAEVRSTIRPLTLSTVKSFIRYPGRRQLTDCSTTAPAPRDNNPDPRLQNVIVRRTEYNKLKDRNKELEEQHRAISTSYAVLCKDIKEVEAKNENLEKRIKELETRIEVERSNGLEYARRELLLRSENQGLKGVLSQMRGNVDGDNGMVMN